MPLERRRAGHQRSRPHVQRNSRSHAEQRSQDQRARLQPGETQHGVAGSEGKQGRDADQGHRGHSAVLGELRERAGSGPAEQPARERAAAQRSRDPERGGRARHGGSERDGDSPQTEEPARCEDQRNDRYEQQRGEVDARPPQKRAGETRAL